MEALAVHSLPGVPHSSPIPTVGTPFRPSLLLSTRLSRPCIPHFLSEEIQSKPKISSLGSTSAIEAPVSSSPELTARANLADNPSESSLLYSNSTPLISTLS